jgi:hypothetical protein
MARALAEVTMVLHFAFLAFVVFGGFLAWRWPKGIVLHLAAAGWGFVVVAASLECPLTYVEDYFRRQAGQPGLPAGFIDTYIEGVVYPEQYARSVQLLVVTLILVSWFGAYRKWKTPRLHKGRNQTTPA